MNIDSNKIIIHLSLAARAAGHATDSLVGVVKAQQHVGPKLAVAGAPVNGRIHFAGPPPGAAEAAVQQCGMAFEGALRDFLGHADAIRAMVGAKAPEG